jgi:hypothetical protein
LQHRDVGIFFLVARLAWGCSAAKDCFEPERSEPPELHNTCTRLLEPCDYQWPSHASMLLRANQNDSILPVEPSSLVRPCKSLAVPGEKVLALPTMKFIS